MTTAALNHVLARPPPTAVINSCRSAGLTATYNREQLPVLAMQADLVLTPVLAVLEELEAPPGQRVERVRHPDASVPIMRIGCS